MSVWQICEVMFGRVLHKYRPASGKGVRGRELGSQPQSLLTSCTSSRVAVKTRRASATHPSN